MGEARRVTRVSAEDYLAAERDAEVRHEYVDGELFAMAGARRSHNTVVATLARVLGNRLTGGPCRIGVPDMKVQAAPRSRYYYPDIVVSRNDPAEEPDEYTETHPCLLVEVLSESTAAVDRREKRMAYQRIEFLVDYVLVDVDARSVERWTRDGDGWTRASFEPGESLALTSIGTELSVAECFADLG